MSQQSSQEKTEKATPKKIRDARNKGQVARARDLVSALVVVGCFTAIVINAAEIKADIEGIFAIGMQWDKSALRSPEVAIEKLGQALIEMMYILFPLFLGVLVMAIAGNLVIGGWVITIKSFLPQASRINPLSGLKRMAGKKAWIELFKSVLKVIIIFTILYQFLDSHLLELINLQGLPIEIGVERTLKLLIYGVSLMLIAMILFGVLDIPNQIWQHNKELKMTKQDIKDEMKNTEGKPEVKQRIRQIQRKIAQRKFEVLIPTADAIITNPTHFSVAVRYDPNMAEAPFVIAKGKDDMALLIRRIAKDHQVNIVQSPQFCRALYFSTSEDQQIPESLYSAMAHILHFVNQLNAFERGQRHTEPTLPNLTIPSNMRTTE